MSVMEEIAIVPEDKQRADLYNFLGLLLARPADEMLLSQVAGLTGDDSEIGKAVTMLARVAKVSKPKSHCGARRAQDTHNNSHPGPRMQYQVAGGGPATSRAGTPREPTPRTAQTTPMA